MSYRDPLVFGVELWVAPPGREPYWLDIAGDVSDEGVEVTRGRPNESGQTDPSTMKVRLRSLDGKYAPRNPRSPLYGLIGRNTPIRAWVEEGLPRLVQWDFADAFVAPAAAATVTSDLDVRLDVRPRDGWRPGYAVWVGVVQPGGWGLAMEGDGRLGLYWWTAADTQRVLTSTEAVPGAVTGRRRVRATLDVDNGSGKTVATFYTAPDMAGPWTQLGAPAVADGTTAIAASAENLTTWSGVPCEVYGLQVLNGIAGTAIASVNFTADYTTQVWDPSGHWRTSVTDAAGVVWQQQAGARLWNRRYRFRGEVSVWPQTWGLTGPSSVTAQITASGIMRRLGTGAAAVQSAIRRGCESLGPSLVAYWPCQDGTASRLLEPAGLWPAGGIVGEAKLAAYSGFTSSDPIVEVESARLAFSCPPVSATGQVQVRWLSHFPEAGLPDGTVLVRVSMTGDIGRVDVFYQTGGAAGVLAYGRAGQLIHTLQPIPSAANDRDMRMSVELEQDGADVLLRLVAVQAGFGSGVFWEDRLAGTTVGAVTAVEVNPARANLAGWGFGHLTVERAISSVFDIALQLAAYDGERADVRSARLCAENAVDLRRIGAGAGCERMGPQRRGTVLDLLREAVTTEAGILLEPRDAYGLGFRTLESLCSQDPPPVTIPYSDNLLIPLAPTDDDTGLRNRVTVSRRDGASATVEDTTSVLSTAPPPDGAGIYDEAVTLSLARDGAAVHHAGWRVHLGTVDEARWPQIGLDLAHPVFAGDATSGGDPALVSGVLDLDLGDRLDVTGLPPWLPPDDVRAIVQGYTETWAPPADADRGMPDRPAFHHRIVLHCSPASPYQAGRWVASGYLTETNTTTTTTTTTVGTDPTTLVEDDWTGTDGAAWSATWTTGFTGSGTVTLQSGWGRIAVGSSGIVSRRLASTPTENAGNITFKYRVSGWVFPEFLMRHNTTVLDRETDYGLRLPTPQDGTLRLYRHASYAYGSALAAVPFPVVAGQVVRCRILVDASNFKVKVWADGASEPAAWNVDATDTTITAAGYWGFYAGSAGTAGAHLEIDDFHWDDGETGETTVVTETTSTTVTATPVAAGPSPWRWDNPNSRLVTAVDGVSSGLQVEVTAGPTWTTDTADLPFDIVMGGEIVTVTAVEDLENLAPNPVLAVDATGWSGDPGSSGSAVAGREAIGGFFGPAFFRITF